MFSKITIRKLKQLTKDALGLSLPKRAQISVSSRHLGSGQEGWVVCAERIQRRSVVYSFGVGKDISFDLELVERTGATVHAFDPTPEIKTWLKEQSLPAGFIFHDYGLGRSDGMATLFPHQDPANHNHSLIYRGATANKATEVTIHTLPTVMSLLGHDAIDLLKMDIEGSEFTVINDMLVAGIRPLQLLVEFHHGKIPEFTERDTVNSIKALNHAGYRIFHLSPSGREYSFLLNR